MMTTDLEIMAASYERQISDLVAADDETADYVARLEYQADRAAAGFDDDDDDDEDEASGHAPDAGRLVEESSATYGRARPDRLIRGGLVPMSMSTPPGAVVLVVVWWWCWVERC